MQRSANRRAAATIGVLITAVLTIVALAFVFIPRTGDGRTWGLPARRPLSSEKLGTAAAHKRVYYIAADEVEWNYVPAAKNLVTGQDLTDAENVYARGGTDRIGSIYRKAVYHGYTDATFSTRTPADPRWQHLGTLGPVIHAEVGDTIEVHFKNNTRFPESIHPHGVSYAKDSEGAPYSDGVPDADKGGASVPPGGAFVYHWDVPERAGPGPMDGSSVLWMYHGHVDEVNDVEAGLAGAIIVTKKGMARPDGTPLDVDREFVTLFQIMDENVSPYLDVNIQEHAGFPLTVKRDDADFQESNKKHSINGYLFGNLTGLSMYEGERVRWYVMDLGSESDLHSPHWHGETGVANGMRTDMLQLLPGGMQVLDMQPDDAGTWLFHCHINDHIRAGMQALFTVLPGALRR
jgi:FtsP/CotA-like multicopper oxidase with cupredoxin domain